MSEMGVRKSKVLGAKVLAPRVWGSAFAVLALGSGVAQAQEEPVLEKLEHGQVDWSAKTVLATGSGAPDLKLPNVAAIRLNAERAAKLDALRNIVETLKGVRITSKVLGSDPLGSEQVRAQVEGIVRGCKTVDTRYFSDGGVDLVVRCPLDGGLSSVLVPVKERLAVSSEGEAKHSSLVVDATGLGVEPALSPRVLGPDGRAVFAMEMVSPTQLLSGGAASFAKNVEAAKRDPRAGKNPLVVKASAVGAMKSEVILPEAELAKLGGQNLGFLAEGRVVIVTGAP